MQTIPNPLFQTIVLTTNISGIVLAAYIIKKTIIDKKHELLARKTALLQAIIGLIAGLTIPLILGVTEILALSVILPTSPLDPSFTTIAETAVQKILLIIAFSAIVASTEEAVKMVTSYTTTVREKTTTNYMLNTTITVLTFGIVETLIYVLGQPEILAIRFGVPFWHLVWTTIAIAPLIKNPQDYSTAEIAKSTFASIGSHFTYDTIILMIAYIHINTSLLLIPYILATAYAAAKAVENLQKAS